MKIHSLFSIFGICCATAVAQQQNAVVAGGPVLGYVFDQTAESLRPIRGIPGAATIGDPLATGFAIQRAAVASQQGYALAVVGGGLRFIRWNPSMVSDIPITGIPNSIYLSPKGTAAAVVTDGWLGFISDMGNTPQVAGLAFNAQPVDAAVSDDGSYLLAALQDGSAALFGKDGTQTSLPAPAPISRVAFRPGSTDAVAASTDNRVWLIQQTNSSPVFTLLAQSADGIADPVGLGFVPGTNRLVIANAGTGAMLTVDVVAGTRSSVSCGCKPVRLEPTSMPGVFRLTASVAETQYLFDGTAGQTFFVPALPLKRTAEKAAGERRPED